MPFGLGGFGISGSYGPAYVPSYVDWRHTAGYGGGQPKYDLEDMPDALSKKLDKKMKKQAVRAHSERMNYVKNFKAFRKKVISEMKEESLERPGVELLGEELNPDKDLIYVTYVIDEDSVDQMEKIQNFIIEAFHAAGLGEYFRAEPEGAVPEKEEEAGIHEQGDIVVWVWPRRNHDYPQFNRTPVDYFNPSDDEEAGGAGF